MNIFNLLEILLVWSHRDVNGVEHFKMMKPVLLFAFALSVAIAFPVDDEKPKPQVLKNNYVNNGDKGYNFE